MSDPRLTHDCDDQEGPGLAPLLVIGVVSGTTVAVSAALFGAGWLLVIASYWLAGTAGILCAAAVVCGAVRVPRSTLRTTFGLVPAMAAIRRART